MPYLFEKLTLSLRRDGFVLAALLLISAYLLFDSLVHLLFNAGDQRGHFGFLQHRTTLLWLLPVVMQFACCLFVWKRFRNESKLRLELAVALQERADEMSKFQNILEATPMRISIQSPEFKVLYQNPAHVQYIGQHAGSYCYQAYCRKEQVCQGCPLEKTFADGGVHILNKSNLINGQERFLELVSAPLKKADGTIVAGIEVVQDMTERVLHERRIHHLSEQLEENNRELRAFSSALAHDLRQPLTRTYMSAQFLAERTAEEDREAKSLFDMVLQGCEQMEELVEGMLTLGRVDQELLRLESVDLTAMVDEILLDLRVLDPQRNYKLNKPDICRVYADRRLLRILLVNLLSNAWKYTRDRSITDLQISCRRLAGEVEVALADNGIGFSMHDANDLFRPFTRLHQGQDYPGIGIGLATARRVVHRHGGRIWATGQPGQGARFFFTLPHEKSPSDCDAVQATP